MSEAESTSTVIKELTDLLLKGNAHVSFKKAVENIPFTMLGETPHNIPYSIWQLTEHIRIAQEDILEFCRNENYKDLNWPDDYWPQEKAPASEAGWNKSLQKIEDDCNTFISLLTENEEKLHDVFAHGSGQTLFREALVLADHNSYHTGEIILLRRLLGIWGN